MSRSKSTLEKISTVTGAYAGARTASDLAANILYTSNIESLPVVILTDFAFMLIGSGVGAVAGNKGGKLLNKLTER